MESICFSCTNEMLTEEGITCKGFCKSTFHLTCVKLTAETRDLIRSSGQLFWMCAACTKMMKNATFRQAIASTNEAMLHLEVQQNKVLEELRSEIQKNTAKINAILDLTPRTPKRSATFDFPSINVKRPRVGDSTVNAVRNQQRTAFVGSREIDENIPVPIVREEAKCWLYLSKFDPRATVDDISRLVRSNLEIETQIDVVKLVPRDRKLEELTYVSFKVGVGSEYREKAMSASSWQKGIYFREFEFHRSNEQNTFRLPRTMHSNTDQSGNEQ